ncbi:MAG: hypothetical protein MZV70_54580 [Desulfobacterales bacterium]|nr:hypothetical protein [Desulfobacterales bacterium]
MLVTLRNPVAFGYADFAVLVRTNEQVRVMADGFKKFGIPFQAANRSHLFKRRGVIELVSFLRLGCRHQAVTPMSLRVADLIAPRLGKKVLRTFKQWGLKKRLSGERRTVSNHPLSDSTASAATSNFNWVNSRLDYPPSPMKPPILRPVKPSTI